MVGARNGDVAYKVYVESRSKKVKDERTSLDQGIECTQVDL